MIFFPLCFSYLILLFRWQRWHSSYEPKQQFFLFKVVVSSNNKIKIWQRSNKRSFYAQKNPCSWHMSYRHLTRTHWQTITYSEWIEISSCVMKCFLHFCTLHIIRIFYWFLFTTFNITFKKDILPMLHKNLSPHRIHYPCTKVLCKNKREKRKFIKLCVVLQSFKHSAIFLTAEVNAGTVERCGSCNFLCFSVLLRGSK